MSPAPEARTVLVTGGAGYIGAHACKALAKAGYTPVAYDSLVHGHAHAVRWGPLEIGDIADAARLSRAFSRHRPAAVMHFAALAYVGESVRDPQKYYRNNVAGTLCLLEAMREAGIGRMVFSSSCATYGTPARIPIDEATLQAPINPYGASKLMGERMIGDFGAAYGLSWMSLRYFNAAGADPDGEIGEDHSPETHLIPLAIAAALGSGPPLTVFGTDYDTPDGTCIRDYVHVCDLADAHVLALSALERGAPSMALNLGTGRGWSVREIIDAVERVTGRPVPLIHGPRRPGDPATLVADANLAWRKIQWRPTKQLIANVVNSAAKYNCSTHRRISFD